MANGLVAQAEQGAPMPPTGAAPPAGPAAGMPPMPGMPTESAPVAEAPPKEFAEGTHPDDLVTSNDPGGGSIDAPPELQEAYTATMQAADKIIHGNSKTSDSIITILERARESGGAQAVGQIVNMVMGELEHQWEGNMPEEIILGVGDEISDLVLELAEESGAFAVTEELAVKAKGEVVKGLVATYGVDPQDIQGAAKNMSGQDIEQYSEMFGAKPVGDQTGGI